MELVKLNPKLVGAKFFHGNRGGGNVRTGRKWNVPHTIVCCYVCNYKQRYQSLCNLYTIEVALVSHARAKCGNAM